MRSRRAVTLPELLLVVIISAMLMALLLPALQGSLKASGKSVVTSQLQQYYLAWQLYEQDFGQEPLHTKSFVEGAHFPPSLLTSKLDPVPTGTFNVTFSKIGPRLVPEYRCSHIARRDVEAVSLFPWPVGDPVRDKSTNLGLAISPAGRVQPGEQSPPGFILFQEGPYFRLLENGSIVKRDVQADFTQITGWVKDPEHPDQSSLCGGIDLLFFDPPKEAYLDICKKG